MKDLYKAVADMPLFNGLSYDDFVQVSRCISAKPAQYKNDEILLLEGDEVTFIGLIVSVLSPSLNGVSTLVLPRGLELLT